MRAFSSAARRVPLCSLQALRELEGRALKFPLEITPAAAPRARDRDRDRDRDRKRSRAQTTGFVFLCADSLAPRAFVNRCPHARLELDLDDSDFFCDGFLQCKAHGAVFDPTTGMCLHGPTARRKGVAKTLEGLQPLRVEVDGDQVVLVEAAAGSELVPPDAERYRREKQLELAAARARHAADIQEMQRQLDAKARARMEVFARRSREELQRRRRPPVARREDE